MTSILESYSPRQPHLILNAEKEKTDAPSNIDEKEVPSQFEYTTIQDRFLTFLQDQKPPILDKNLELREDLTHRKVPPLDSKTIEKIIALLTAPQVLDFKDKDETFFSFTLIELIQYFKERAEKEFHLTIKNIEIVGGMAFWVLVESYLGLYLNSLGIQNPESFLTPELLEASGAPNDFDIRINVHSSTKEELEKLMEIIKDFLADKLKAFPRNFDISEEDLKTHVHNNAFLKLHTQFDDANRYSTVCLKGNIELLIVQDLARPGLFRRDCWRIQIDPSLKEFIPDDGNAGGLALIDRLGGIIRAFEPQKIDQGGLPALMSAFAKGMICVQDDLESILWETHRKAAIDFMIEGRRILDSVQQRFREIRLKFALFNELSKEDYHLLESAVLNSFYKVIEIDSSLNWVDIILVQFKKNCKELPVKVQENKKILKATEKIIQIMINPALEIYKKELAKTYSYCLQKVLKNHHDIRDPKAAFAVTFQLCSSLKNEEEIHLLWQEMRSYFSASDVPLILKVDALLCAHVAFEEVAALLFAKSFFQLHRDASFKNDQISLSNPTKKKSFLRINLGGSFLNSPFNPIQAFQILSLSKNSELKTHFEEFIYPKGPYAAVKKLDVNWEVLEKISYALLEQEKEWGMALLIVCLLQTQNEKAFAILHPYIRKLLSYTWLMKSLKGLCLNRIEKRVVEKYFLSKNSQPKELRWVLALTSSGSEHLTKWGYDIWSSCSAEASFNRVFVKDLSISRPDLAIQILISMRPEDISKDAPELWNAISASCQARKKSQRSLDLPELLKGVLWLFAVHDGCFITQSFLEHLSWLCQELNEQNKIGDLYEILKILKKEKCQTEVKEKFVSLWRYLCETITADAQCPIYLWPIWELAIESSSQKIIFHCQAAILNSAFIKEGSQTLIDNFFKKLLTADRDSLVLAEQLLAKSKWIHFLTPDELILCRSLFLEKAYAVDFEFFKKMVWRQLKLSLEIVAREEPCSALPCAIFLKDYLKAENLSQTLIIKGLVDSCLGRLVAELHLNQHDRQGIKLLKRFSLKNLDNRVSWFERKFDELAAHFPHSFIETAALSLSRNLLKENPHVQEIFSLFDIYQKIETLSPASWAELFQKLPHYQNRELHRRGYEILIHHLEKNQLWQGDLASKMACCFGIIKSLESFPKEVMEILKEINFFKEALQDDERGEDAFKIILNALNLTFKNAKMGLEDYQILVAAESSLIPCSRTMLSFLEAMSGSQESIVLQAACAKLIFLLENEVFHEALENQIVKLTDSLCKIMGPAQDPLLDDLIRLMLLVRNKCPLAKIAAPLIDKLGTHPNPNLVMEACLLFEALKGKQFSDPKLLALAIDRFLNHALKNHFQISRTILIKCFENMNWMKFLHLTTLPGHFSFLISQIELDAQTIIGMIHTNFLELKKDFTSLDKSVKIALNALCRLPFSENILHEFLHHLGLQIYQNSTSSRKGRKSKGKQTSVQTLPAPFLSFSKSLETIPGGSLEALNPIETKIQDWKIYFLTKYFSKSQEGIMEYAYSAIRLLFRTKNKNSTSFEALFNLVLFNPFAIEQMDAYLYHLEKFRKIVEEAIKEGWINSKSEFLIPCLYHVNIPIINPPINLALFAKPFEEMLVRLLAQGTEEAIKKAIFMIQDGKTRYLNRHFMLLIESYKRITQKILESSFSEENKLALMDILQKGVWKKYPRKMPHSEKKEKQRNHLPRNGEQRRETSKEICTTVFRAIFKCKTMPELNFKIAHEFLMLCQVNNFFEGQYSIYLQLIEFLMHETIRIKDKPQFFINASQKIYLFILTVSPKHKKIITAKEKEARAAKMTKWLELLIQSSRFETLYSAKIILKEIEKNPHSIPIFEGLPNPIEATQKGIKKHLTREKFQKGCLEFIPDYKNLLLFLEYDSDIYVTDLDFKRIDFIFEALLSKNYITEAIDMLREAMLGKTPALIPEFQRLCFKWLEQLLFHNEDGLDAALKLWDVFSEHPILKKPYNENHTKFVIEIVEKITAEARMRGNLLRRNFVKFLIKAYPVPSILKALQPVAKIHLDHLIQNNELKTAEKKHELVYKNCLSKNDSIIYKMKIEFSKYKDGITFDFAQTVIYLLHRLDDYTVVIQDDFLDSLILKTLEFLFKDSYFLEEQTDLLNAAEMLLKSFLCQQLILKEPLKMAPFQELFSEKSKKEIDPEADCKMMMKIERLATERTIPSLELKQLFKMAAQTRNKKIHLLVFNSLMKRMNEEQIWEGTKEDQCICWLLGMGIVQANDKMKAIYFLNNYIKWFSFFENVDLQFYKYTGIRSLFIGLEKVLCDRKQFLLYTKKFYQMTLESKNFITNSTDPSYEQLKDEVCLDIELSLSSIHSHFEDVQPIRNILVDLAKWDFSIALPYQIVKARKCIIRIVKRIALNQYSCYREEIFEMVCQASARIRTTSRQNDGSLSLLKVLVKINHKETCEEACYLAYSLIDTLELKTEDFKEIYQLFKKAILNYMPGCYHLISKCLLHLNQTKWCETEECAQLWMAFIKANQGFEPLREFNLILASLSGFCADGNKTEEALIFRAFDLIINKSSDKKVFNEMMQALFKRIDHYYYLKINLGNNNSETIQEINRFNFLKLDQSALHLLKKYNEMKFPNYQSSEVKTQSNEWMTKFYLKFMEQVNSVKSSPPINKEVQEKDVSEINGFLMRIYKHLDLSLNFPIFDRSSYVQLLINYVFYPLPSYWSQIDYMKQILSSKCLIEKAQNLGLFDSFPDKFFQCNLLIENLVPVPTIRSLTIEEKIQALEQLLEQLLAENKWGYSSLIFAQELVQSKKPSVLEDDAHCGVLVKFYKRIIKTLEKNLELFDNGETHLERFAKNTLVAHCHITDSIKTKKNGKGKSKCDLPSKFLEQNSTNPFTKRNKTPEWQEAAAEANKELFLALCRQEWFLKNHGGSNLPLGKSGSSKKNAMKILLNVRELKLFLFKRPLDHLNSAREKNQFDGHYERYLQCVSFFTDLSLTVKEDKDEFKMMSSIVFVLLTCMDPPEDIMKEKRRIFMNEWFNHFSDDVEIVGLIFDEIVSKDNLMPVLKVFPDLAAIFIKYGFLKKTSFE